MKGRKKGPTVNLCKSLILLARPRGIEPLTKNLEGSCSIQLSYGRIGHGAEPSRVAHNIEIAPHAVKHQRQPASPQNTSASLPSAAELSPSSHLPAAAPANLLSAAAPANLLPAAAPGYSSFCRSRHPRANPPRAARQAAVLPLTYRPLCAKLFA